MYGMSEFAENLNSTNMLNAQNCVKLAENFVH